MERNCSRSTKMDYVEVQIVTVGRKPLLSTNMPHVTVEQ